MVNNIVIIGGGGFAMEVTSYINAMFSAGHIHGCIKGYLDKGNDNLAAYGLSGSYLGSEEEYVQDDSDCFVLGMADTIVRANLVENFINRNRLKLINVVHPLANVSESAKLGLGNVIGPMCHVGSHVVMGDNNVLNYGCSIGHDSIVGSDNIFSSCVGVAGYVNIQDNNYFGITSSVIPRIRIGNNNKVHAGTVVTKNISDKVYYYQNDMCKQAKIFA